MKHMKDIDFAYIAPTQYLDLLEDQSSFHLLLAHLLEDDDYVSFYKKQQEKGDFLLLDNGAFEFKEPLQSEEILDLMKQADLFPDAVVAPDYPFEDWKKTYMSTVEFIDEIDELGLDCKVMAVPQSERGDVDGWLECYHHFGEMDAIDIIGMSILAIPTAWEAYTKSDSIMMNRIFASNYLANHDMVADKWHHYLGLGEGPRELLVQRQIGIIDTSDSSSPVWHGINGIRYDNTMTALKDGKIQKEVDFDLPYDKEVVSDIIYNVNYMENHILN